MPHSPSIIDEACIANAYPTEHPLNTHQPTRYTQDRLTVPMPFDSAPTSCAGRSSSVLLLVLNRDELCVWDMNASVSIVILGTQRGEVAYIEPERPQPEPDLNSHRRLRKQTHETVALARNHLRRELWGRKLMSTENSEYKKVSPTWNCCSASSKHVCSSAISLPKECGRSTAISLSRLRVPPRCSALVNTACKLLRAYNVSTTTVYTRNVTGRAYMFNA